MKTSVNDRVTRWLDRNPHLMYVTVIVNTHQASDLKIAAKRLRENPNLTLGPLRDTTTMKLVSNR